MEQLRFPELVDIARAAELLAVSERYVRRMVAERRIPIVKLGRKVRIDVADLQRYVEENRRTQATG